VNCRIHRPVTTQRALRACRFFRAATGGRDTVWLCLLVILFNLLGPVSWVAAHQTEQDGSFICLAAGSGAAHDGSAAGSTTDGHAVVHCPLCLMLGGAVHAPPANAPVLALLTSELPAGFEFARHQPPASRPLHWRPDPRGPPVLI
jgi:hypothetical protein